MEISRISVRERVRYLADWTAVQSQFVDELGQTILYDDRLTRKVIQLRGCHDGRDLTKREIPALMAAFAAE
jgi:hypothetical protein